MRWITYRTNQGYPRDISKISLRYTGGVLQSIISREYSGDILGMSQEHSFIIIGIFLVINIY